MLPFFQLSMLSIVFAIDPALGRLDPFLMSEESLLETFFDGCSNKSVITDANGIVDLSKFEIERNEDGNLRKLQSVYEIMSQLGGSVNFAFLPPSMEELSIQCAQFSGSIMVEHWPASLRKVNLYASGFKGTIDAETLPRQLEKLDVSVNYIEGPFETRTMPRSLVYIDLSENNFSGTFNVTHLPKNLQYLWLYDNSFSGEILISERLTSLQSLGLSQNAFTHVTVVQIHPEMRMLDFDVENKSAESLHMQGVSLKALKTFADSLNENDDAYDFEWVVKARRRVRPT